jgi:hypothetical protein
MSKNDVASLIHELAVEFRRLMKKARKDRKHG